MTGNLGLNWVLLSVSLFNTILLLWLGLTVVLNAERRTWGMYLAGGALLLGGLFFLSHSAILGYNLDLILATLNIWWQVGWIPLTFLPFAWYAVMLWYSGYWTEAHSGLRQRHRTWFLISLLAALGFLVMIGFTHALPSIDQVISLNLAGTPVIFGLPVLVFLYPLYTVLCTGLSLDVLWQPGPSARPNANSARQRARPWLGAASLALFVVSLLVGGTVFWVVMAARQTRYDSSMALGIGGLDLLISGLIGLAILLMGQAVISYEIFTGKTLPRRGLQRQWQRVILLALAFCPLVSLAVQSSFRPINILLVVTVLLAVSYALLSWRSFEERERFMDTLRPFITSQGMYEDLVSQPSQTPNAINPIPSGQNTFNALCATVLETRLAYLVSVGPFALLAGPPLVYPPEVEMPVFPEGVLPRDLDGQATWLEVDPASHSGAFWAVPLNARGRLVGALFLGQKVSGGMYTHEEVELARLAGERILDALASAEISRRLMALQRQRMSESQVVDRRAKRILHDDILPHLHTAMLSLSRLDKAEKTVEIVESLSALHGKISALLRELPTANVPEIDQLGLEGALRQLVEHEYRSNFDRVSLNVAPKACQIMATIPGLNSEVLYYAVREAVRNAARHARGMVADGELNLEVTVDVKDGLEIQVKDDGIGLQNDNRLWEPASKAPVTGQSQSNGGQGLELHSTLLAVLGGRLEVHSLPGENTTVIISLPLET